MKYDGPISDSFSEEELDGILEHFEEASGDLEGLMDQCYEELMQFRYLNGKRNEYLEDAVRLNYRLCFYYNLKVENYLRVKELFKLTLFFK